MVSYQARLTIDLKAVVHNWASIDRFAGGAEVGAVVKANAYGLGMDKVVRALHSAGCRTFYVANLSEGIALKGLGFVDSHVVVLQGCYCGEESLFLEYGLKPVLVSEEMLLRWVRAVQASGLSNPGSYLKVDTGMNRLGLRPADFSRVLEEGSMLKAAGVEVLMSHLACADEPSSPMNQSQLKRFVDCVRRVKAVLPEVKACLSNSEGVKLGAEYHFDILRPGIALYGGCLGLPEMPIKNVVSLSAPVVQIKELSRGDAVGYGAEFVASSPLLSAVVAVGYADGVLRSWSPRGRAWFGDCLQVLGRVSMDSVVLDISSLDPDQTPRVGDYVELVGDHATLLDFADSAGTITYEVLTRLGDRLKRNYLNEVDFAIG